MAATDFSRQIVSHNNITEAGMMWFAGSSVLSDCESPDSISVRTKQPPLPSNNSENLRHRLDPEQRKQESGDDDEIGDDEEEEGYDDEEDEEDNDVDDDDDHEGANDDKDHQHDILAQFNDDPTNIINDSTNLQDCIDALDSVIEQVPSYHIYNNYQFGGSIHETSISSDNTNNHSSPIVHQRNNHTIIPSDDHHSFEHNTLYNYSSLDCFIVHPELIHPQIHDPILHHHTSSTSLSYASLLDSFDVSPSDVERIMDSVVGDNNDTINDIGDIVRKEEHTDRYFVHVIEYICFEFLKKSICRDFYYFMGSRNFVSYIHYLENNKWSLCACLAFITH